MIKPSFAVLAVLLLPSGSVLAQHAHTPGMTHPGTDTLTEPGQGAFAALAEVVAVLEADPHTDWSRVDLDGLRAHLVDMDLLVTGTVVDTRNVPGGVQARATGPDDVLGALKRMVPAHAAQLAQDTRWTVRAETLADAVTLTVTATNPATEARIRALGFFGLMASQDHHRAHHLDMARGAAPHGH